MYNGIMSRRLRRHAPGQFTSVASGCRWSTRTTFAHYQTKTKHETGDILQSSVHERYPAVARSNHNVRHAFSEKRTRRARDQRACHGRVFTYAPRVLRSVTLRFSLCLLLGRAHRPLALQADGRNKALDIRALGDGLTVLLELTGDHVLPYVILLRVHDTKSEWTRNAVARGKTVRRLTKRLAPHEMTSSFALS